MNGFHFSDKTGKSYYYASINKFLKDSPDLILHELIQSSLNHGFEHNIDQNFAWENQISELQEKLKNAGCSGDIIFEYDIVRLGKRIDVVLLIKHMVFSLEFKNGAKEYKARDAEQAEDYALDLKNFHKESENLYVCPILIATDAKTRTNSVECYPDNQVNLQFANSANLMETIRAVYEKYGEDRDIDFEKWYNSPYCPTPSIIQGAVAAYQNHSVTEIAQSEAGQKDIDSCERKISEIVKNTRKNHSKCICFITGVPGAGKTLVGLDMVAKNMDAENKIDATYLSGNGPLIAVLRKALIDSSIQSVKDKNGKITKEERNNIRASIGQKFIMEAYNFRKASINNPDLPPNENLIIFDEAQRCWDKNQLSYWSKTKMNVQIDESEPEYFISIMDRRKDWAVIICLVGLGQDIYKGEVGINEWFESCIDKFPNWDLYYSPKIFEQIEDKKINKEKILSSKKAHQVDELHLSTSIRSFRSEKISKFVDYLLDNNPSECKKLYNDILKKYPLYVTRDFNKAKEYVRSMVRGSQRSGVIASSSAQRLKPEGIFVPTDINVEQWFLAPKEDLRSSNAMEVVASEFKIQGLEIDYSIVCWDADLRRLNSGWDYYSFSGTSWKKHKKEQTQNYLLNSYRVLLTRARQAMVIFVPKGVDKEIDETRDYRYYDSIYNYLTNECGIKDLKDAKL